MTSKLRREMHTGFKWGKLKERHHLEYRGTDARIISNWTLKTACDGLDRILPSQRGCQFSSTVSRRFQNHNRFRSRENQVVLKRLEVYIRFLSRLLFVFAPPSTVPIPMAAWSKVWVCCRSLAGIGASNPAGGMDVSRQEESYRVWCV